MSNDMYHDETQNEEPSAGESLEQGQDVEPIEGTESPDMQNLSQDGEGALKEQTVMAEEKIAALEGQVAELKDQYLRKAAEFENFRKRMNREKQEAIDFANQNLLLDLIQILDDFDRAIRSAETSKDFSGFYEGISMIEKRLSSQLENRWALKRFDSEGEVFDPNRHEAIMMDKAGDITEPIVQEDLIKGYTLKDRVIRSAKVKVLMPENPETGNQELENPGKGETQLP